MQWWWYFMAKGKVGILFFSWIWALLLILMCGKVKKKRNAHKLLSHMKELQQSFGFHQQVILEFLFGSVGRKSSWIFLCSYVIYSGFLSIVSNSYPRVKHRMCSDTEILFTSQSVYVTYCCCCLVTKSCPILCDSVDWRLLCPWDFPGKNTWVACHFFLQGTFLTQGLNPHLLHWQADSLPLSCLGSPYKSKLMLKDIIFKDFSLKIKKVIKLCII